MQLFTFSIPKDGKEVATDSTTHWLHDAKYCVRGNRRVHGGAALLQNVDGGLRGEWLAGACHPVLRDDFRARRKTLSHRAVAGESEEWQSHSEDDDALHRFWWASKPQPDPYPQSLE